MPYLTGLREAGLALPRTLTVASWPSSYADSGTSSRTNTFSDESRSSDKGGMVSQKSSLSNIISRITGPKTFLRQPTGVSNWSSSNAESGSSPGQSYGNPTDRNISASKEASSQQVPRDGRSWTLLRSMTNNSVMSKKSKHSESSKGSTLSGKSQDFFDLPDGRPRHQKGLSHFSTAFMLPNRASSRKPPTHPMSWRRLGVGNDLSGERNIVIDSEGVGAFPSSLNCKHNGQPNRIFSTRFTLLTWLPRSLFHQFQCIVNIYFLLICILVNFKFSPKDWKNKVFPFIGVLLWAALKDLHEDWQRRRDDAVENEQRCCFYDFEAKDFEQGTWQDVFCGDVLLVRRDEAFPADMILLHAEFGSEAYISTLCIDGETNLQERRPPIVFNEIRTSSLSQPLDYEGAKDMALQVVSEIIAKGLKARMDKPEFTMNHVNGSVGLDDLEDDECPVCWNNVLPRGCTLKNTSWVLGLVTYVGDETKARLNTSRSHTKISNMQVCLNRCVRVLLMFLVLVCAYSATMSSLRVSFSDVSRIRFKTDEFIFCCDDTSWLVNFAVFLITFYHVVPMSLHVLFDMLRLLLCHQVNNDDNMVDPETGEAALARRADLIEDLGQIGFLFADKSGTLTTNEMAFARCCIGGLDLGDFRDRSDASSDELPTGVEEAVKILQESNHAAGVSDAVFEKVWWFFICIAVCHSLQVQTDSGAHTSDECGSYKYLGASPDEVALVEAARQVGIVLIARKCKQPLDAVATSSEVILSIGGPLRYFKNFVILHEFQFNSDRKRMSVVCSHEGNYYCITKGADSVMENLLLSKMNAEYAECLQSYSQQGLRTLIVAMKILEPEEFHSWERKYVSALAREDDSRDARVAEVVARMESDLKLVGIAAVEDRLQDGVPETIATIKKAGVRVWVLTGDKVETTVEIARSCLLIDAKTKLAYATNAKNSRASMKKLEKAQRILENLDDDEEGCLVLDGETIGYALHSESRRNLIYDLGLCSRSCICCRLTPFQKRQLVELVRLLSPSTITLAIGDGANDVPMIEGAHIGIAIRGKEGNQAVQVCDVAISKFRFLVPLLLHHGRHAYRRVALFLCYYFYKNVVLAMADLIWMHQDDFRGRVAFPEYLSINYNFLFTSLHVLFVVAFDEDSLDQVAVRQPKLYLVGPSRSLFNRKVFAKWMIAAVYHGTVAWLVPNLWFGKHMRDEDEPGSFWIASCTSFTIIVIIVCLKLLWSSASPFKIQTSILPSLVAFMMYCIILALLSYTRVGNQLQPSMKGMATDMLKTNNVLISLVAIPCAVGAFDAIFLMLRNVDKF